MFNLDLYDIYILEDEINDLKKNKNKDELSIILGKIMVKKNLLLNEKNIKMNNEIFSTLGKIDNLIFNVNKLINSKDLENTENQEELTALLFNDYDKKSTSELVEINDYDKKNYLVYFKMNNCKHCSDFENEWYEIINKNLNKNLIFSVVVADNYDMNEIDEKLIERYQVKSYPTLILIKDVNDYKIYEGEMNYTSVKGFLLENRS